MRKSHLTFLILFAFTCLTWGIFDAGTNRAVSQRDRRLFPDRMRQRITKRQHCSG